MIHILSNRPTENQMKEMLEALVDYIKLAVDVERKVVAGGGGLHADCETELLADGSKQEDIWGADWIPAIQSVAFEALINIRPRQNNPSMRILDSSIRARVKSVVRQIFEGV